jgi:hypothetical protein
MARGRVDPAAMKAALQASLAGRSLTEILVERGELSEADLARAIAEHHRLDYVDLELFEADREAATLIAPDLAARLGAVPIAFLPTRALVVALHDPNGSPAVREIAQLIDRTIQPAIASRTQIVALIDSLRRGGQAPGTPPSAPAPEPVRTAVPEKHLRSMPAGDIVVAPTQSADDLHPTATPQSTSMPPRNESEERARAAQELTRIADARAGAAEEHARAAEDLAPSADPGVHAAEERAQTAEDLAPFADPGVHAAEERAQAAEDLAPSADSHVVHRAEERAQTAEDPAPSGDARVHAAEERARAAEERAICVEQRALAAEAMAEAANARADGMMVSANVRAEGLMAAAVAANEALARLVGNCELLESEAQAREGQMQALRGELDTERARPEAQLRQPPADDELIAMHVRVTELERELDEERARARRTGPRAAAGRGGGGGGPRRAARGAVVRADDRHPRRSRRSVRAGARADGAARAPAQAREVRGQGEGAAATHRCREARLTANVAVEPARKIGGRSAAPSRDCRRRGHARVHAPGRAIEVRRSPPSKSSRPGRGCTVGRDGDRSARKRPPARCAIGARTAAGRA